MRSADVQLLEPDGSEPPFVWANLFAYVPLDFFIRSWLDLRADIALHFRQRRGKIALRGVQLNLIFTTGITVFKIVIDNNLLASQLHFLDGGFLCVRNG